MFLVSSLDVQHKRIDRALVNVDKAHIGVFFGTVPCSGAEVQASHAASGETQRTHFNAQFSYLLKNVGTQSQKQW